MRGKACIFNEALAIDKQHFVKTDLSFCLSPYSSYCLADWHGNAIILDGRKGGGWTQMYVIQ